MAVDVICAYETWDLPQGRLPCRRLRPTFPETKKG